jgi:endonuclease YncB( thermonuclease family)
MRYRPRRRHVGWTMVLIVLSLIGYGVRQTGRVGAVPTRQTAAPGTFAVVRDIDGDTIDVNVAGTTERVRLIGVDTPEEFDPRKPLQCFAKTAADFTAGQVSGQNVRLEADSQDSDRDKYHRLLRYVYLPNGQLLNEELIKQGYGFAYVVFPFTKLEQFLQDEADARQQNRGLWAGCNIDSSSEIKQTAGSK